MNPANTPPAIEFRNVYLSFDEKPALEDISFRLESGEMAFLTGISGSGKSVLLRLAIGPTMSLDPIVAIQVLDLIIRARDVNHISSLYSTKKIYEIPHLARLIASQTDKGEIVIAEAPPDRLPRTKVIVLDRGRIAFSGNVEEFQKSDLPAIKELMTLDRHDHSKDPYFVDPWDKRRHPKEKLL